jgi:hypothetical protein
MSTVYDTLDLALATGQGLLIGRNGSTELGTMIHGTKSASRMLLECAGVWDCESGGLLGGTSRELQSWLISSRNASGEADLLATGWYEGLALLEQLMLEQIGFLGQQIKLRDIEPYYSEHVRQWTRLLAGVNVCCVSPFYKSVSAGYRERQRIWPCGLLPEFGTFNVVRSYFAPMIGGKTHSWISGYEEAVDYMEAEVLKTGAKVVLIGCGGLGMILGARLKKQGLICIVMGGALQVLFGIKGRRWAHHGIISQFWNDHWLEARPEEIPPGAMLIEGGCYW